MKDKKPKGGKKAVIGAALVQGALAGLSGDALYAHVQAARPATGDKAIAKAALRALSDPGLTERAMLDAVYNLAVKLRFEDAAPVEAVVEPEVPAEPVAETAPAEPEATVSDGGKPEKKRGKKAA